MTKLKIGVSGCLLGQLCNHNGEGLDDDFVKTLQSDDRIQLITYCPEDSVFGSPRKNSRIVGGDGYDVLKGKARVIDEEENDITESFLQGAYNCLNFFKSYGVDFVILTEGSPSCGRHVVLNDIGWPKNGLKKGQGVTAALLFMNEINVVSQFDKILISQTIAEYIENYEYDVNLPSVFDHSKIAEVYTPLIIDGEEIPRDWPNSRDFLIRQFKKASRLKKPKDENAIYEWKIYEERAKSYFVKHFLDHKKFKNQNQAKKFLRFVLKSLKEKN